MNIKFIFIYVSIIVVIIFTFYYDYNFNRYKLFAIPNSHGAYRFDKRTGRIDLIVFGNDTAKVITNFPINLPTANEFLNREVTK